MLYKCNHCSTKLAIVSRLKIEAEIDTSSFPRSFTDFSVGVFSVSVVSDSVYSSVSSIGSSLFNFMTVIFLVTGAFSTLVVSSSVSRLRISDELPS